MNLLTLPELLDILDYTPGERVTINTQGSAGRFTSRVARVDEITAEQPQDVNVWFGICPVRPGTAGRGKAEDVTRLPALWADLDVKPGGCPDMDTARAIIDDLSMMLNVRPAAVIYSGHGLQPLWAIDVEDGDITDDNRAAMQTLLRRWGRLVAHVADLHHSAVDSVYDLPRILRAPGSVNHKSDPVAVLTLTDTGRPLALQEVDDALLAYGIPAMDGDDAQLDAVQSDPSGWAWAPSTCSYASRTIKAWIAETPRGRHPWLTSCYVRLAAMHAHDCITQDDHTAAKYAIAERFRTLLATGEKREETPGEIAEAYAWGIARAATFAPDRRARELGNHPHLTPADSDPNDPFGVGLPSTGTDDAPAMQVINEPVDVAKVGESFGPTEDGTARAFVRLHSSSFRYCPQRGWLHWIGSRWEWDEAGRHRETIKAVARSLPSGEGWASYKRRALSASGISGIATQAQTDPSLTVHIDQLDSNPYEINTPGGIVDLRTGRLRPADPDALHTRTTAVAPDFDRTSTLLTSFLDATFGGDAELIGYVQRVLGLAAIGTTLEQVLPFGHGSGANGKSTLLETAMHTFGRGDGGYAISAPSEMLMMRKYSEHPAEIAQLAGARLVVLSELEDGARFAEARIKQLTGRDSINARFMARNPFTFTPSHTFFLLGNSKPAATTGGDAFWRRLRLIPFAHTVPEQERDPRLGEKLATEADAFLAWVIDGARDYLAGGMRTPAAISEATAEYARDEDTVGRFVEDRLILSPAAHVAMRDVRHAYETWCSDVGEIPVSAKRLGSELRRRWGLTEARTASTKSYVGAMLTGDESVTGEDDQGWYR